MQIRGTYLISLVTSRARHAAIFHPANVFLCVPQRGLNENPARIPRKGYGAWVFRLRRRDGIFRAGLFPLSSRCINLHVPGNRREIGGQEDARKEDHTKERKKIVKAVRCVFATEEVSRNIGHAGTRGVPTTTTTSSALPLAAPHRARSRLKIWTILSRVSGRI